MFIHMYRYVGIHIHKNLFIGLRPKNILYLNLLSNFFTTNVLPVYVTNVRIRFSLFE